MGYITREDFLCIVYIFLCINLKITTPTAVGQTTKATLAQLVELRAVTREVVSSTPARLTLGSA